MTDETKGRADSDKADQQPATATPPPRKSHGYKWFTALLLLNLIGGSVYCWFRFVHDPDYDAIAEHRAYAEVRIRRERPKRMFDLEPPQSEREFQVLKESMARQVKGKFVLADAMRKPGIADLPLLKRVDSPLEFLEEQLEVDFPAEEFMRISLNTPNSHDAAAIVNAVYESFLKNVVEIDQQRWRSRRKDLEDIRQSLEDQLRTKQTAVKRLTEVLETGDMEVLTLNEQLEQEKAAEVRRQHAGIQAELIRARTRLKIQESMGVPDEAANDREEQSQQSTPQSLQERIKQLEIAANYMREQLDSQRVVAKKRRIISFELQSLKKEIKQIQDVADQISSEIQKLSIELGAMPRVTRYQEAEPP